jgi:L-alanine-DL-glutamate epimerase-like enolase superfamily enzyme
MTAELERDGASRRAALSALALGAGALWGGAALAHPLFATRRSDGLYAFGEREPLLALEEAWNAPIIIDRFDMVEAGAESVLLRVVSRDGAMGVTAASPNKWAEVRPLLVNLVKPFLLGKDARRLERHLWDFSRRQYEYAGAPMWNAWGHAECAVLDLLGQVTGRRVADLLGGVRRTEIPFYISSNKRGGPPEAEVEALRTALAESGCMGVKIKVGARMNRNRDAEPGWTPGIVRETRRRLGDAVTIYADANGAYDAPTALEVARLLEDHDVAMFEEPCPGDDMVMTGQVTAALSKRRLRPFKLLIGGGENEGNPTVWRQWIDGRHLDVAQPDPQYGGGLIHCIAVARLCAAAGLKFNPHWPREGAEQAPLVHLCAAAPELWGLQEYRLRPREHPYGPVSTYRLENGVMKLPDAPGFGVGYDPALWTRATPL